MNTIQEASTERETFIPFLIFDLVNGSSTGDPEKNYVTSQTIKPEYPWSDTSDPKGRNILRHNKSHNILNTVVVDNPVLVAHAPVRKYVTRLLRERVINDTMVTPTVFNITGTKFVYSHQNKTDSNSKLDDIPAPRVEAKELVSTFREDVRTEGALDRYELVISDIIDRYGTRGIAALQAEVFEPAIEPLGWKFLNALGVRRGQPIDNVARAILLRHLNSISAGQRSAAASALGAFPDAVVLAALERRAAVENNRIVLATLKAHIQVLKGDAASTPKNI